MSEEKFRYKTSPIAEMQGGIVLARFEKPERRVEEYQTESQLEENMINNLVSQGYERLDVRTMDDLYINLRVQIEKLNDIKFSDSEWKRFLLEYLDAPNDGIIEKTRKIQENHIYDFIFDDGRLRNIKIIDKKNIHNNHLQVVNQVTVAKNRYDVSILVNGLPLVHIELKKRGVNIREAFNQIQRYEDESFNLDNSLYKFVQIFVISNGTYTRYFANTTERDKSNYEFTCEWADAKNRVIVDLEDFTATFFEKRTILEILTKYCIFNSRNVLLIMRPYQIAATERLLWRINSSFENKKAGSVEAGGFIWHTTGSGKTLTSFKSARLATELDYIDKVFFVVDRKDLDYQTMREYQKFQKDSVNGSKDTKELKISIEKQDNKIVVTTIQKLNEFVKSNKGHEIYNKHCVFIYDECHRSQFGLAQKNIQSLFKHYYQFGFTGTPILVENSIDGKTTTASVFGAQLHSYVITDAIRDGKVLKFKIDYNSINPKFKSSEEETDDEKLKALENKMFIHPERISEITKYILDRFDSKTYRNTQYTVKDKRINGFNAMFAVQSVDAAKMYYEEFKKQQANLPEDKKLKVATIFSYAPNEERASGEIEEESMSSSAMSTTAKQFLTNVVDDYNSFFQTNFTIDGNGFENYYKDLSSRVRNKEVDLLIVVGMFLTGFDAPTMNTLFVDKNLRYHGLIQAFSRTNRILNKMKAFGNIVCFRNLEKATKDAIKLFGDENSINVIIERSYDDYINGFTDEDTGVVFKGYKELCEEIIEKFPDPTEIKLDKDKKEFVKLFGEILKRENILRNYDEFSSFEKIISERLKQDMKSVYIWIKDSIASKNPPGGRDQGNGEDDGIIDFADVEFHIDLLKTEEVNLDYILALILEKAKEQGTNNETLKEEIRRLIRSSLGTRAKEELIIEFINRTDLTKFDKNEDILEAFYEYAKIEKEQKINELISEENLKEKSKKFIEKSISRGYVAQGGTELDDVLPPTRRVGGEREAKKQSVLSKLKDIVKVFVGI